ncbi:uncharacterized protein BO97DRAFT_425391 [Aspergillus homomorphus CBS 101889]|uniref:DUF4246 domain-containing protein n=1 Tax=Aspergillus homomorphus (strain CBS 101889) TaxID=1450537 RepID=A0A395HZN4_ASPHC|nr:hypothetical protein BO97DRAFT_425391 [Aspergillus homomorphus CBS 101889]RAL11734.1 hypothetical protein BO97DRAFT_425391 [Aspergillus homomorphus CBS 101889]
MSLKKLSCVQYPCDATLTPVHTDLYRNNNRMNYTGPEYTMDLNDLPFNVERWRATRRLTPPSIDTFHPLMQESDEKFDLQTKFRDLGLQVFSSYDEGKPTPFFAFLGNKQNEHICATAVYYYSNHNVTSNGLNFRQRPKTEEIACSFDYYDRRGYDWLKQTFGCENQGSIAQVLGSVQCRQGCLITFPNILQHRVEPFQLADPTKPGHRKILTLLLAIRIFISYRPPTCRPNRKIVLAPRLPLELQQMINDYMGYEGLFSKEEEKRLRLEAMEERSRLSEEQDRKFEHIAKFDIQEDSLMPLYDWW